MTWLWITIALIVVWFALNGAFFAGAWWAGTRQLRRLEAALSDENLRRLRGSMQGVATAPSLADLRATLIDLLTQEET